jgi:hypothetical protein
MSVWSWSVAGEPPNDAGRRREEFGGRPRPQQLSMLGLGILHSARTTRVHRRESTPARQALQRPLTAIRARNHAVAQGWISATR